MHLVFKHLPQKNTAWLCLVPALLLCLWFVYKAALAPLSDFEGYYFGSKFLLAGIFNNDVYFPTTFNHAIYTRFHQLTFISYTPFPPFTALFFVPFSVFPIHEAKLLFNLCNALLFVYTLFRLHTFFKLPGYGVALIPLVLYLPLKNNFLFGQAYLVLVFLLSEGFIAYSKGKHMKSAVFWSIAILLKAFPVILFGYLIANRSWKTVSLLALCSALLFLTSLCWIDIHVWENYILHLMPRLASGELNNPFEKSFQSMFMLLKNVFVADELYNKDPLLISTGVFVGLWGLYRAALAAVCFSSGAIEKPFLSYCIWIMASLLLSPNGSTYSLVLLLFPLTAAFAAMEQYRGRSVITIGLIFLIAHVPWKLFLGLPLLFHFPRLYLFLALFIVFYAAIHHVYKFNWKYFAFFSLAFILPFFVSEHKNEVYGTYYLGNDRDFFKHGLVTKNGHVWYSHWTAEGLQWQPTHAVPEADSAHIVCINNNQVYVDGVQITNSSGNKKDPIVTTGNQLLYLSDKNRGIGFFTIRRLDLSQ